MASSSTRAAMRLLSPRLQCLQKPARCTQIRHMSSRYSNPGKRNSAAEPARAPSFVGEAHESSSAPVLDAGLRPPMSARDARVLEEERKQYHLRRMRFAGMGLLMTLMGLAFTLYNLDLDQMNESEKKRRGQQLDAGDESNKRFQGKQVEIIGAGDGKRIVAKGQGQEIELVETGTSSVPHFPRTIYLPTSPESTDASGPNTGATAGNVENQEQYTLVGLGIRTVSFLSIQVYVVGMYIRTNDITTLQEKLIRNINESASTLIPSEKDELRKRLTDPASSRELWTELLKTPGLKTAWRISPTRNTDFGHLRDGWITGITNRTREFKQLAQGAETEFEAEDFGKSVGDFQRIFAGGKAPKGSNLILSRDVNGELDVWFQEKPASTAGEERLMRHLGRVEDERISKLIWLGYLGGEKVSSEAARKGVAEGCVLFAARPIGSVEAMVT